MPRLPKPPGGNKPTSVDELIEVAAAAATPRMEIDLLTALVSAGHDAAAEALVSTRTSPSSRAHFLAWMSWCTRDADRATSWAQQARASWAEALEGDPGPSWLARGWSAIALLEDDPTEALERACEPNVRHTDNLEPIMAMLALGRLDEAVDQIELRGDAVKQGVGWRAGVMELYDSGFIANLLARLVSERRWDLLGRVCVKSEAEDGAFLASICLSQVLRGRDDIAEAFAELPSAFLGKCFLSTVGKMPADAHASIAPLVDRLPPSRRAVGEVLLGDPSRADALLAEQRGRAWDSLFVAMLRDDQATWDAVTGWDDWKLKRTSVGAIRVLAIHGDPDAMTRWVGYIYGLLESVREKDRPQILAQMGRELCFVGRRALGERYLIEAFEMAHALDRSSDQGWSRNNALERVGNNATRARAWMPALKSLQKCTGKYNRAGLASLLALEYAKVGDFGGAAHTLTFIKPDQTVELYRAGLRLIEAVTPGLNGRFNQPRRAP